MKRLLKYAAAVLFASLCAFSLSGCLGVNIFALLLTRSCNSCGPHPDALSSLAQLRGEQYVSFADGDGRLSFRLTDGKNFGGYGCVAAGEQSFPAYFHIDYRDGDVYVFDASSDSKERDWLFRLSAEFIKEDGVSGIKIERSYSCGGKADGAYDGLFLAMSPVTDFSVIKPYEYIAEYSDAEKYIILSKTVFELHWLNGDCRISGVATAIEGTVTAVTAERDRTVRVSVRFYDDYTFEIYEIKTFGTETVSAADAKIASGTYSYTDEKSYTLHFTEDSLFLPEFAAPQFPGYPDIKISRK